MQHTSVSPDRRLIAIVGDHVDGLLVDSQSGKVNFLKHDESESKSQCAVFLTLFLFCVPKCLIFFSDCRHGVWSSGLLVRLCLAPRRAHIRHGKSGQDLPRLGHKKPIVVGCSPEGQLGCDKVNPLLVGRPVHGGG